jgi:hypothetical protein
MSKIAISYSLAEKKRRVGYLPNRLTGAYGNVRACSVTGTWGPSGPQLPQHLKTLITPLILTLELKSYTSFGTSKHMREQSWTKKFWVFWVPGPKFGFFQKMKNFRHVF